GKISNLPIKLDKSSTGFKLDTINNTYEMEFGIECDDLFGIEGISFGMGWKDLKFDMIKLGIDRPITAHPGGVPVTFRNFGLKVADMSEMEKVSAVEILKSTLEGSLDVEMLNLAETFPKVTKIITNEDTLKDMCVLSLPETTLSVNVRNMKFALNAKLMFVKTVELASAEILIGKFDFNNELLFANGEVSGLQASVSRGIKWKTDNMDLNLSGTTQVNGHSKFVGLSVDGTLQLTLDIWLIEVDKKTNGEVTVGMHFPDYANGRFVVACKYLSPFNNVKSWMCYIDADGSTGSDKNYL
ncbi:MAG: hypothetical protein IJZ81_02880, partial [Clostridia bacterium]|nr:hypothetical protein [Clostridia bacterium]